MDRYCRICRNASCSNHGKDIAFLGEGWKCNYIPVPTNADRIRAMSDEKLADAWIRCNTICHLCAYRDECEFDEYVIYEKCKEGIMEWLKQPADMRGEEDEP